MAERSSSPLLNLFREYISVFTIPQKPSTGQLSMQCPTRDMDCSIPCFESLNWNALLVYWSPPVTVEQRVCIRILANCLLKCVKYQLIVIASAYDVGDNRPVIEIEDSA